MPGGCKVGFPGEFDFLVSLDAFEDYIEKTIPGTDAFTALQIKIEKKADIAQFVDYYNCLDSRTLFRHLKELVIQAFYEINRNDLMRLHCGHITITDMFSNSRNIHDLSTTVVFWRAAKYKSLAINFDINPVTRLNRWPVGTITFSQLLPHLHRYQVYLFPKSPQFPDV